VPLFLCSATLLLYIFRHFDSTDRFELAHPHHVRELGEAIERLRHGHLSRGASENGQDAAQSVKLFSTSAGLVLSSSVLSLRDRRAVHFSISRHPGRLELRQVRRLAILISRLNSLAVPFDLEPGSSGVFHILFSFPVPENNPSPGHMPSSGASSWQSFNSS